MGGMTPWERRELQREIRRIADDKAARDSRLGRALAAKAMLDLDPGYWTFSDSGVKPRYRLVED